MKRFLPFIALWIIVFVLFQARRVSAQHGEALPLPADAWKGQVSGKVVNQTTGKTVVEPLDVMLHAWDGAKQERLMLCGKAEQDGSYSFEDVDFHPTFSYSVMATYLGATYFSNAANVQQGETSLKIDAQVFDTTQDVSSVRVDQLHVLFYIEEGQLGISQFYALSNSGKLTVKDAVTLPRDRRGTLKFHLPDEAQNVKFGNDSSGSRYVLLPGGFADTTPIPPGEMVSQVVVGYNLPYEGKLEYNYVAPAAVEEVNFLVLEGSGLSLQGKSLTPAGEQTLQDGSKFSVFNADSMKTGEGIQLTLTGKLKGGMLGAGASDDKAAIELGIGAGTLGLALIAAGIWWWRQRGDEATEEISENTEVEF